jgi:succinyl-diaminopimelate desuccinylase
MSFAPTDGLTGYPQYRVERIDTHSQMHASVLFQVRTVPGQNDGTLRADLQRLLDRLRADDPHFEGELEFPTAPSRAAGYLEDVHPLVQAVAAAHRQVVGHDPEISARGRLGAACDASLFAEAGIPTIMYGPGGGMTDVEHQRAVHEGRVPPDERVSIQAIVDAARVYAAAAVRLCG